MDIKITNVRQGQFAKSVAFQVDGVAHTAVIFPQEQSAQSALFAFGAEGDSCQTTQEISNPAMLAAVVAALSE